ncbi:MAG: NYN domain-containing protein [Candidatus Omnitrophota bacterium]
MSLCYIVDGYNVLKSSNLFKNRTLQEARAAFVSYVERNRLWGSLRNKLVIVFDGSREVVGVRQAYPFEIIFTRDETADEKICRLVIAKALPRNIVVVTDDKGLIRQVRSYGVKIMSCQEFLGRSKIKQVQRRSFSGYVKDVPEKDLNLVEKEKITEELKNIWLKKEESS